MDLHEKVKCILDKKQIVMLETIANDCSISELESARALPEEMRAFCAGDCFDAVWQDMETWASATFIIQHAGNVLEIKSKIPSGKHSHGYFNLEHGQPLSGHIKAELVSDICFLSLPFMGKESHSIQFFDKNGAVLFAVYVGREKHALIPEAKDSFISMRTKFCHN